jgi:putative nucleotidyltransferase with HDIG domain
MGSSNIKQIAEFAQSRLKRVAEEQNKPAADMAYRWEHIQRVTHYGRQLAEAEGANMDVVIMACLLHDIALFDPAPYKDHGRLGAEIARRFLEKISLDADTIEAVVYAISTHVDIHTPESLEARILTDADNIDRYGPLRIVRWVNQHIDDYPTLIDSLRERIEHVRGYRARRVMLTDSGHALFNQQLDRQIAFFEALLAEAEITKLP